MPSVIDNCLARLVRAGRVTPKQAEAAKALHDGLQGRLGEEMGPIRADAESALEAARAMADAAKQRKLAIANTAISYDAAEARLRAHPQGESAGLVSILTTDPWNATRGVNIERHTETTLGKLFRVLGDTFEPYASKAAGLKQDMVGIRNVVRELYGIATGDDAAAAAAKGWRAMVDYALGRHRATGAALSELEDWRLPQMWDRRRVTADPAGFKRAVLDANEAGRLTIMDKITGQPAVGLQKDVIVDRAIEDIKFGRIGGSGGKGFNRDMRVFRMADADSWLDLMDKWGSGGGGIYDMMISHMQGMSREIAMKEVLSPNYEGVFKKLHERAVRNPAPGMAARTLTGPRMADLAFQDLTGKLSSPQSEAVAGFFGALRNIKTASSLGTAFISAVPGDSVSTMWAAHFNGMSAAKVIGRTMREMLKDPASTRAAASRLNIIAHAVIDSTITNKRFEDTVVGRNLTGRIASTVMRASGLQGWTNTLKRSWSMEFNGLIADQSRFAYDNVDGGFRRFLQRYGFTPDEWDQLRQAPLLDIDGAQFFDIDAAGKLGDRLSSAILDERSFAVLEPNALTRAFSTAGTKRGTIIGEVVRSGFMFKSFSLSIMLTHVMRALTDGPVGTRIFRGAAYMATMTLAGAMGLQAKQLIAGKEPRDMGAWDFWWGALAQGGGAGIYGDLVYSATTRGGQGITSTLAGPVLGEIGSTVDLISKLIGTTSGKTKGEAIAQWVKRWTPGSTLWYSRLATDRWLFDVAQRLLDPQAGQSFARQQSDMQRDYGQQFWWAPGAGLPGG